MSQGVIPSLWPGPQIKCILTRRLTPKNYHNTFIKMHKLSRLTKKSLKTSTKEVEKFRPRFLEIQFQIKEPGSEKKKSFESL